MVCRTDVVQAAALEYALVGQLLDLGRRHAEQLAIDVLVVLAVAGRAAVDAPADVGRALATASPAPRRPASGRSWCPSPRSAIRVPASCGSISQRSSVVWQTPAGTPACCSAIISWRRRRCLASTSYQRIERILIGETAGERRKARIGCPFRLARRLSSARATRPR